MNSHILDYACRVFLTYVFALAHHELIKNKINKKKHLYHFQCFFIHN